MKRRTTKPDYKAEFLIQLAALRIKVEPEFRFCERKWKADWILLDQHGRRTSVLIEYQGGIFSRQASHSSIGGQLRDIEKTNEAILMGYTVIQITPKHVVNGMALQWVERALKGPFCPVNNTDLKRETASKVR